MNELFFIGETVFFKGSTLTLMDKDQMVKIKAISDDSQRATVEFPGHATYGNGIHTFQAPISQSVELTSLVKVDG